MAVEHRLKRKMIIMVISLVVVFGLIFGWDFVKTLFIKHYFATFQPPPVTISATEAKSVDWHPQLSSVGTLGAANGVMISPEVSGIITQVYFSSGQYVKKGTLLVTIDDAVEQAQLKNYQAALVLAQLSYQRALKLYQEKAGAKADLDSAQATLVQAQANVAQTQAVIAQKNIVAPFDGKLGIDQINTGQYVSAGTPIVSLQASNPIHVSFWLPEKHLEQIYMGEPITIETEPYPDVVFHGTITAMDSEVNTQTHNIEVEGTIPNPSGKLYPGLFASVHVLLPIQSNVIVVPQTAVNFSLYGNTVYVITPQGKDKKGKPILKAHQIPITIGEQRENQVVVLKGLKAGELVVTSGQLKLTEGATVTINNDVKL